MGHVLGPAGGGLEDMGRTWGTWAGGLGNMDGALGDMVGHLGTWAEGT